MKNVEANQKYSKTTQRDDANEDTKEHRTIEIEDKMTIERRETYLEPEARNILRKLLEKDADDEIIPIFKPGSGFIYKVNQSSNNNPDLITKKLLEKLSNLDILQKKPYESAFVCQKCESTTITMHSKCPKCKSHNVNKTSLTEHIPCGYIDQKNKYKDNKCPKCHKTLVEGEYRNLGRWYVCRECAESFEKPQLDLTCRDCNTNFSLNEAELIDIPKFFLNESRVNEIRQNVAGLEDIRKLLTELEFEVKIPGYAMGIKSGMQHHFSLIATRNVNQKQITIALDHAVSDLEVQSPPLILYIYKTSEIEVDIRIFIAIPQIDETSRRIAQGHDILLIEGSIGEQRYYEKTKNEIKALIEKIANPIVENSKPVEEKQGKSIFKKIKGFNK